jgi:hypothetical protein
MLNTDQVLTIINAELFNIQKRRFSECDQWTEPHLLTKAEQAVIIYESVENCFLIQMITSIQHKQILWHAGSLLGNNYAAANANLTT